MMTLRDTTDLLASQSYPLTASELVAACGDHELDEADGGEALRDVIERSGDREFDSALDATFAVYGAVGQDAVGRVGYSDRDPTPMGVDGPDQVSF